MDGLDDAGIGSHARIVLEHFAGSPREEVFAVGDVHGRADLLHACLDVVSRVPTVAGIPRRLVLLGDLTDRGPAGVEVVDLARGAEARLGHPVTTLMGNHDMMLAIVCSRDVPDAARRAYMRLWAVNGGIAVLDELAGAGRDVDPGSAAGPDLLAMALGPERVSFLRSLPSHYVPPGSDLLLVHAGVDPDMGFERTFSLSWMDHAEPSFDLDGSWAWVREPFLDHVPSRGGRRGHHGRFVLHGHSPYEHASVSMRDMVARDRLNLDTMAVYRGRLRMARVLGNRIQVFDVGPTGLA